MQKESRWDLRGRVSGLHATFGDAHCLPFRIFRRKLIDFMCGK